MTNKTKQSIMWLMTTTLLITSAVNYCNAEIENQRTNIAQFDTGMDVDIQELMDAQSQTNKLPQPAYLSPSFSGRYSRITRDCRYIEFGPNSSLMSGQVLLESRYYEEICHNTGGHHGGGGHSGGGHHDGGYNDGSYHGRCGGVNLYGKYYHGGGCNAFGCWRDGGGCGAYGCWQAGGGCNAYGCWRPGGSCHFAGCVGKWHGNSEPCIENEYDNDRDPSGGHQGDGHHGHNDGYNNQHGGHPSGNHGQQTYCEERLVHTERRSVRMEVMNRGQIFPWEKDVFQVCLRGQDFQVDTMENASHTYDFSVNGHYDLTVTAMAGAKLPTRPDPNGIFMEGFVYEPGSRNFRVSFGDKWTNYYTGERTQISLKLKKDRRLWGDEQILSKVMLMPAQGRYEVDFASFAGEFSKPLEAGQKYYVEWSFARIGSVSKPVNNEGGQTSRIILP